MSADESKRCGDIIYPSQSLKDRILSFNNNNADNNNYLRSIDAEISINLQFINQSDQNIFAFWIKYDGDIRNEATLIKANDKISLNSFKSHPFIFYKTENIKQFTDIIGVYIPQNDGYAEHKITINKEANKIKAELGKMRETKTWTMDSYEKYVIKGFTIYFEIGLLSKYRALLHFLKADLQKINALVPAAALKILHSTSLFMNDNFLYYNYEKKPVYRPPESMCFHPDGTWLTAHGNLVQKAECVEVYRVKDWIKDRAIMPMVLLHELAHAYHWYLDFERADVLNAFKAVKDDKDKLYESVPYVLGGHQRAYALENECEYFAECTEAYFGMNDFYPFNREELEQYDRYGFTLMETIWFLNDEQLFDEHQKALQNRREQKEKEEEEKEEDVLMELDISRVVSV